MAPCKGPSQAPRPAWQNHAASRPGAAIGGAGGAVVGAVVPGLSTGEGALIGAAGGAVVGDKVTITLEIEALKQA